MIEKEIVLEVKNLKKYFPAGRRHMLRAVDDVSFTIHKQLVEKHVQEFFPKQTGRYCIRGKMCII